MEWTILPLLPSRRASSHFGLYSFPVSLRVGGWVGLYFTPDHILLYSSECFHVLSDYGSVNDYHRHIAYTCFRFFFLDRPAQRWRMAYIIPLCFFLSFFFFFSRLISEVSERISPKLGHINYSLMIAIWKIWSKVPRAFTLTGWGAKKLGTNFELWPKIYLQRNTISTIGKELVNPQGFPYMPLKFDELWSTNGWERLASFPYP